MKHMQQEHHFTQLLLTLCLFQAFASGSSIAQATQPGVTVGSTSEGIEFAILGEVPAKPAPTLIILSGVATDSLLKPAFLQAGKFLAPKGYLCVSIDLPCHGKHETPGTKGLGGWAKRAIAGEDFVAEFNLRMSKILDHLIAQRWTDSDKIAVCGTSRGGFLAYRFAAHDPRVKCAVGYSPVTDLRKLSEFRNGASVSAIDDMSAEAHVDKLVGRPVFVVIGDRDERVSTDAAVQFARALSAAALKANVPSGVELHVISEPRANHTTPTGADEWSAKWIYRVLEGRELSR